MLSPKQTKFHVPAIIVSKRQRKHISCCRLCGSVKDVLHCKNLFKKATEELLAFAVPIAVFGGTLQEVAYLPS